MNLPIVYPTHSYIACIQHYDLKIYVNYLEKIGFTNFTQLNGGLSTDFDKPFIKDKFFNLKFGSGDLRILCQKK